MPEILNLGPFMIKLDWVLLALSGIAGYMVMSKKLKATDHRNGPLLDQFTNGLLFVFLIWKLSPVIFQPSLLWTSPFSLLTMSGSASGVWLGMIAAALYMERALRKMKIPRMVFLDLLSIGMVTAILVYSLLGWQYGAATTLPWGISIEDPKFKYHPINVYIFLITLPLLIWQWRTNSSLGAGNMFIRFTTYYAMGLMLVSLFKPKIIVLFGLSAEQLMYLSMMILGFLVTTRNKGRAKK
jgi:hypothetical protein